VKNVKEYFEEFGAILFWVFVFPIIAGTLIGFAHGAFWGWCLGLSLFFIIGLIADL
jgi:hypothetical protein